MLDHVTFVLVAVVVFWGTICSSEIRRAPRQGQLSVRSMFFRSHVRSRFATTVVTSTVVNDAESGSEEALFEVVLPEEAFIANFSMTVDGEVYPGRVEEKKKAMTQYQEAKRRGQSAGYIKTTARRSNKFDVTVNLKAGSTVTFNLTYQQLLTRSHGLYEHKMHLNPGRVVPEFKVEVFVEDARPITKIVTSMKQGLEENRLSEEEVRVEEPTPRSRYVEYRPTREQQAKTANGISGEFVVKYDVERTSPAGEILVVDGYFIHSFAPENYGDLTPVPKDIVFVLDVSGSMSGTKISQLKDAMNTILSELNKDDTFNIFSFNDYISRWKHTLVPVNPETIREGLRHVENLRADGSTDINKAMTGGVQFLMNHRNRSHVQLLFFLTDGQPTSGVKDPASIANNVERDNEGVASVFGLAFGEGADYNLVKIVAVQNSGFARRIYEGADASEQVKGFYDEISNTMVQNLTVTYFNGSVEPETLTPTTFRYLFKGTDVTVAGRVSQDSSGANVINGVVSAESKTGTINLVLDNDTDGIFLPTAPENNPYFRMPVDFASFTEKTWAYLTIKSLLKQKKKLTYKNDKGAEAVDKQILELSLKYKFVTPLTSMVATKPDEMKSRTTVEGDEYGSTARRGERGRRPSAYPSSSYQRPSHGLPGNAHIARSPASGMALPQRMIGGRKRHYSGYQPSYDFGIRNMHPPPMFPMRATRLPPLATAPPHTHPYPTDVRRHSKSRGRKYKKVSSKRGKSKKSKRTCKLVKIILEGYGMTVNTSTNCVKVRRVQNGAYQLYPAQRTQTTDFSVQAAFIRSRHKPNLHNILIQVTGDNLAYNLTLDPTNTTTTVWKSPNSTFGHVTIQKHVTCRGRRGIARVFVNVHLPDQQDPRSRRDVVGRIRKKMKKSKKRSPVFQKCQGRLKKESLTNGSPRFVPAQSSMAAPNTPVIKI